MKCPADCLLVSGQNLKCKEDALTGEPDEILKTPLQSEQYDNSIGQDAILFAKSTVSNGVG
jgi:magnesium-transporting ATPase (P-type)